MKYIDEFNDPELAKRLLDDIHATVKQPWAIMEVCGGQTHSIIRHGIDQLIPDQVEMIHGPGCPVCVTPLELIDKAIEIAFRPAVIFCSFGDMLRVPGSETDLLAVKPMAVTSGLFIPHSTQSKSPAKIPPERLSSSRSDSRQPRRPMPWL